LLRSAIGYRRRTADCVASSDHLTTAHRPPSGGSSVLKPVGFGSCGGHRCQLQLPNFLKPGTDVWWASVVITIPGDLLATSAIRHSLVETLPELNLSVIFPSVGSSSRRPLPSTGSLRARFPGFLGTMSRSDSPPPIPAGSFPRPAVPWCAPSLPPRRRTLYLSRVNGFELYSSAASSGPRKRPGLPGSWRTLGRMPCSPTPAGS